jgi:hypothetical protein
MKVAPSQVKVFNRPIRITMQPNAWGDVLSRGGLCFLAFWTPDLHSLFANTSTVPWLLSTHDISVTDKGVIAA